MSRKIFGATVVSLAILLSGGTASAQTGGYDLNILDGSTVDATAEHSKIEVRRGTLNIAEGLNPQQVEMFSGSNSPTQSVNVNNSGTIDMATVNTSYRGSDGGRFTNEKPGTVKSLTIREYGLVDNYGHIDMARANASYTISSQPTLINRGGTIGSVSLDGGIVDNMDGGTINSATVTGTFRKETQLKNVNGTINSVDARGSSASNNAVSVYNGSDSTSAGTIHYMTLTGENAKFENGSTGTINELHMNRTGLAENGAYTSFNRGLINSLTMGGVGGAEVSNSGRVDDLKMTFGIFTNSVGFSGTGDVGTLTMNDGIFRNGTGTIVDAFTVTGGDVVNKGSLGSGLLTGYGTMVNDGNVQSMRMTESTQPNAITGTGIFESLIIDSGGNLDTNLFTGTVGDFSAVNDGSLAFYVGLDSWSTLNAYGAVDVSGGEVSVDFDSAFAGSDWTRFDLADLFNFSGDGYFETPVLWTAFALNGLDGISYHYDQSFIVRGEAPASTSPEPASILILGIASLAVIPVSRKLRRKTV